MIEQQQIAKDYDRGLIIGAMKMGKTHFTIESLLKPNIGFKKMLIVGSYHHGSYKSPLPEAGKINVHPILFSNLAKWCEDEKLLGPRYLSHIDGDEVIATLTKHFDMTDKPQSGLIIFEDITSLFNHGKVKENWRKFHYAMRNKKVELWYQFHSIKETPPLYLDHCNKIILLRCGDKIGNDTKKRMKLDSYEHFCIAKTYFAEQVNLYNKTKGKKGTLYPFYLFTNTD